MNEIFYNGTNTMYNQANFENIQIFIFYTLLYVLIPENYEFTICSNTSDVHVHNYVLNIVVILIFFKEFN